MDKTLIGVGTVSGGDALIYSDGSILGLVEVVGVNGNYFVGIPVTVEAGLKAEDASNADYAELPGYAAPAAPTAATTETTTVTQ